MNTNTDYKTDPNYHAGLITVHIDGKLELVPLTDIADYIGHNINSIQHGDGQGNLLSPEEYCALIMRGGSCYSGERCKASGSEKVILYSWYHRFAPRK